MALNILFIETGCDGGGSFESLYCFLKALNRDEFNPVVVFLNENRFIDLIRSLDIEVCVMTDLVYSRRVSNKLLGLPSRFSYGVSTYLPFVGPIILRLLHYPLVQTLSTMISEKKIDLLYLNDQINRDFFGVFLAKKTGIPCISHLRSMDGRGFNKAKAKLADCYVNVFISNSQSTKHYWGGLGVCPKKNFVVYNGIPPLDSPPVNVREHFGISDDKTFIIGCVGRLIPLKGHEFLLRSFSLLLYKIPGAVLLIIGDGPLWHELEKITKRLGIFEHVVFAGYQKNARTLMAGLDLLILPSRYDAFGRVLIEAMEQNTPVIGTDLFGISEIIEHGYNGLLVNYDDEKGLAGAMENMAVDQSSRDLYVGNAKKTVQGKFSMMKHKASLEAVIRNVCKKEKALQPIDIK